jgi:molybdate transport system regulatory protein
LHEGAVNSEVEIRLPGGTIMVASITKESVQVLQLKLDDVVSAVVKASHVMVGL